MPENSRESARLPLLPLIMVIWKKKKGKAPAPRLERDDLQPPIP
jgi:hypothetical protein